MMNRHQISVACLLLVSSATFPSLAQSSAAPSDGSRLSEGEGSPPSDSPSSDNREGGSPTDAPEPQESTQPVVQPPHPLASSPGVEDDEKLASSPPSAAEVSPSRTVTREPLSPSPLEGEEEGGESEEQAALSGEPAQAAAEPLPQVKLRKPDPRQGQFIALGVNYGAAFGRDEDRGPRSLSHGPNFTLRLGESLAQWVVLGLGFSLGSTIGEDRLTLGRITAFARWYPMKKLFVHTAVGFGFAGGPDPLYEGYSRARYGDIYVLGLGRHFYLSSAKKSGGWLLSPSVTAEIGPSANLSTYAAWLGVEISYWGGLKKNKLALSIDEAYAPDED